MAAKQPRTDIKARFEFALGPRFEIFFALQALTDGKFRIHREWRERARAKMPPAFAKEFQALGGSPVIWAVISDALGALPAAADFDSLISGLKSRDIRDFQREILYGAIHYRDIVDALLRKELTLPEAMSEVPRIKCEWLAFIGLYPYQSGKDMCAAMELLLREPELFRRTAVRLLESFWRHSFVNDWALLKPRLQRCLEEKEKLFKSRSFGEFSKQALLRIEVDEKRRMITAVRGGAELPFDKIARGYFVPSAFNDKRYWTAFEKNGKETVFFPYFEPGLSVLPSLSLHSRFAAAPEPDPYLIFKALGDPTRTAIASLIAGAPASSADIASALKLSKPLVSHHVHVMREAGLLTEARAVGRVYLSLDKKALQDLSRLTVLKYFGDEK